MFSRKLIWSGSSGLARSDFEPVERGEYRISVEPEVMLLDGRDVAIRGLERKLVVR